MRRPVVFLFLSFALGIALEYHFMPGLFLLSGFAAAVILLLVLTQILKWHSERIQLICMFLIVVLFGGFFFFLAEGNADPLEKRAGERCIAEGRILTVQIKEEDSFRMIIKSETGRKRLIQARGTPPPPEHLIGKWASVSGTVSLPSERRNPNLFDYRLYLKTRGVRVIIQTDSAKIRLDESRTALLPSLTAKLKYGFQNRLKKEMEPEAYGMVVGMLFGDASFISEDTYEAFQKNGIAHILSVSGIHVGIVYLYISKLLGNRKTNAFYLITAAALVFYAALSEFSPCVVRAVVMIFIHMFSKMVYLRHDFLTCTAASAIAMLLFNPFYLFNTGFQLSYLAVFCLASLIPWSERRIDLLEERGTGELQIILLRYIAPLLAIQIGMTPATAYLFNYFSVVSLIVNPPIIAISGIIIPLGISLIPLSFLGGFVFGVGAQAAQLLTDAMIWLNDAFFFPGIGFFNTVSPPLFGLFLFYCLCFFFSSELFRIMYQRNKRKEIAGLCCLFLVLSLMVQTVAGNDYNKANLVFVDVGQGDCLHIRTPGGKNILIDGGGTLNYDVGKKILLPYLLKTGVKTVDIAIATHLHTDHYLGLSQLAKNMEIRKFGTFEMNRLNEREILSQTGLEPKNMLYLKAGDRIKIEKGIWIDVLYPSRQSGREYERMLREEEDENKSSLFLKLHYNGLTVLMTGDIGVDGENEIMELYSGNPEILDSDILKVGHHGSRYSTGDRFLEAVSPKAAVFQVGKNNFGHPHPTIIEKCTKNGIIIYRNDQNGAILFREKGQKWHIKVLLQKNTRTGESIKK